MKKFGVIIFIIAILLGVVFANVFSLGRASASLFNFSFVSGIKGSGVAASDVRSVGQFQGVDVGGVFKVEITAGKDYEVEIEADDNLLQYIRSEVAGGVLRISTSESLNSRNMVLVRISAPDIETLHASGASQVSLTGVKNRELAIDTSGASKVRLIGETTSLTIDVSGASKIDAEALKAENASVDASGASYVNVFVTNRLVSDASGASKIWYSGSPSSVQKNTSGSSKVYQK